MKTLQQRLPVLGIFCLLVTAGLTLSQINLETQTQTMVTQNQQLQERVQKLQVIRNAPPVIDRLTKPVPANIDTPLNAFLQKHHVTLTALERPAAETLTLKLTGSLDTDIYGLLHDIEQHMGSILVLKEVGLFRHKATVKATLIFHEYRP